jgi:hypothetical protein
MAWWQWLILGTSIGCLALVGAWAWHLRRHSAAVDRDRHWQFWKFNFDKVLLTSLFVGMVTLVVYLASNNIDGENISWARELTSSIIGALFGLITGRSLPRPEPTDDQAPTRPVRPEPDDDAERG